LYGRGSYFIFHVIKVTKTIEINIFRILDLSKKEMESNDIRDIIGIGPFFGLFQVDVDKMIGRVNEESIFAKDDLATTTVARTDKTLVSAAALQYQIYEKPCAAELLNEFPLLPGITSADSTWLKKPELQFLGS